MKNKLKLLILLLVALMAFSSPAQAALEIEKGPIYNLLKKALPFEDLEFAGYLKSEVALRTAGGLDEFMKEANIAQLETEYKINDNIQFFAILRWFYDAAYDLENRYDRDPQWESKTNRKLRQPEKLQWLREIYFDILTDRLDMRLGKQQVVWGTADGVRILDFINPLDYREWTLDDYVDSRLPLFMANIEGQLMLNGHLQLLLIPDYQANYYPPAGSPFTLRTVRLGAEGIQGLTEAGITVQTIDQKPAHTFENTKIGVRWRNILEGQGFEYTLNYLHTYDFASSAYTVMQGAYNPWAHRWIPTAFQLTRRAEQVEVFGGTFSKTITEGIVIPGLGKGWTLRGEFACIKNGAMNFGTDANIQGTVDVDQYNFVLGFDKSFWTNWLFSFQFIQFRAHSTDDFDKRLFTLLNGATRGPLDKTETILTLKLSTDFMHERLKPEVLVLYGDDNDWRISPKVSYEINDQWLATAGLHIFEGKEQHLNGQFDKNDQLFFEMKYMF